MKITNVTSYIGKGVHIIEVNTDEGMTGFGECSAMAPEITAQIISTRFKANLIGLNPFDIHRAEEICLVQNGGYKIAGQLQSMAYSGIDLALWDIMGKASGQPVYNLLGGKYRDKIEMYGSSMSRDLSVDAECAKIHTAIGQYGFGAMKIKVGPRMGSHREMVDLDADEAKVKVVRELLGPQRKLLVDVNSSYNYSQAITFAQRITQYDIFQYEEPCPFNDMASYEQAASQITLPVNVGEQDWNIHVFKDFIARGLCQIAAADTTKCGGLTNARRVAALCDAYGIVYSPHNTGRGIGLAAHLHLCTAAPACNHFQEFSIEKWQGTSEYLPERILPENGILTAPEKPGLGVEPDRDKLKTLLKI